MARPVVSDLTDDFYSSLGWLIERDEENEWTLLQMGAAWVEPNLDPVFELARERDGFKPWAILYDPDECPAFALPFLAQHVGVAITPEMSEAQIRNEIREPTTWKRGQPEAIRVATRRSLTGENPLVIIHPRTPTLGSHYVRTLLSQTPNPERTKALVRAAVPAWEKLDYEAIEGVTVADVTASTNWETVTDLGADFTDVMRLAEILPTEI